MSLSNWTVYQIDPNAEQAVAGLASFEGSLKSVGSVGTFSGFQSLWNFRCSHARGTIRVFRDDILPLWEHPANVDGASLSTNASESDRPRAFAAFMAVMKALIDGAPGTEHVTGAVISLRPWGYTLSVWLEGNLSAEEVNRIDAALISTIGVKGTFFHYKVHSEQRQLAAAAKAKAVPAEAVDEVGARTGTRTKKVVVHPEDMNLDNDSIRCTRVRARRVSQPKNTLAELEQKWEKHYTAQKDQGWTYREIACSVGAFVLSALVVSNLGSAAF